MSRTPLDLMQDHLRDRHEVVSRWQSRIARAHDTYDDGEVESIRHRLTTAMIKLDKVELHATPAWEEACIEFERALADLETAWVAFMRSRERSPT